MITSKQTGTFAFDNDSSRTFHFFKITERRAGETTSLEIAEPALGGAIYTPETTVVFPAGAASGFTRTTTDTQSFSIIKPFEFRSFGYAFFADYQRKTSFEEVLTAYLGWHDPKITKESDGSIEYKTGEKVFTMDKERDYWITSMNYLSTQYEKVGTGWKEKNKQLVTGCEIQLKKAEGMWVPEDVKYSSSHGGTHHIAIDWKNLNTSLPIDQFETQTLQKKVNKEFIVTP